MIAAADRKRILTKLNGLVSSAIYRAERFNDMESPAAMDAWCDVMTYEEQLAELTEAGTVAGRVARVGAVRAAIYAGQFQDAQRLAGIYLGDPTLPSDVREAIGRTLAEAEADGQGVQDNATSRRNSSNGEPAQRSRNGSSPAQYPIASHTH
jgi:hypothetical protein